MDCAESGTVPHFRSAADGEVNDSIAGRDKVRRQPVPNMEKRAPPGLTECMTDQKKPNNLKTALILGSVALVFFIGVIVKQIWFS